MWHILKHTLHIWHKLPAKRALDVIVRAAEKLYTGWNTNHYTTPSTHHLNAGLKLTVLLQHASLCTDETISSPTILIITHF